MTESNGAKDEVTCKALLHIGDDFGDNSATMTCGLPPGHAGAHQEVYPRGDMQTHVTVTWFGDDSPEPVTCARCGKKGTTAEFMIEEGDEWECPECWERCEALAMDPSDRTGAFRND